MPRIVAILFSLIIFAVAVSLFLGAPVPPLEEAGYAIRDVRREAGEWAGGFREWVGEVLPWQRVKARSKNWRISVGQGLIVERTERGRFGFSDETRTLLKIPLSVTYIGPSGSVSPPTISFQHEYAGLLAYTRMEYTRMEGKTSGIEAAFHAEGLLGPNAMQAVKLDTGEELDSVKVFFEWHQYLDAKGAPKTSSEGVLTFADVAPITMQIE